MKSSKRTILQRYLPLLLAMPLFFATSAARAEVSLPYILSDNMVLQRDVPLTLWGWAKPGEKVTVLLQGQQVSAKTNAAGEWKVKLNPLAAGGPFELTIKGRNTLVLKNILAGDVYVCSGQSNMEWPLSQSRNWPADKSLTQNERIRLFYVPKQISATPLSNTKEARWEVCSEKSAAVFSAVGFYFGLNLNRQLGIPIGLINSNWGGTDIETWTSLETMYADKDYTAVIDRMKAANLDELAKEAEQKQKEWERKVEQEDPGMTEKWYLAETAATGWSGMKLPQTWEGAGLPGLDGVVWFRKEIIVSGENAGKEAILSLGPIDDNDETWVNGEQVGKTSQYDLPREYKIRAGLLKAGLNVIAVKVIDTGGGGGVWGTDRQMQLVFGAEAMALAGDWMYRVGLNLPAPGQASGPNSYPSLLYNAMIHPLINFAIKGAIWYQGENNAGQFVKYRELFPAMIRDWRTKWNIGEFPFLFVQLANYMEPAATPQENSSWAGLREAQAMTLSVPSTGMAVIIDIGEAKDIHPRNKDDVGYRLALAALKVAYGRNLVYSGPVFKGMSVSGNEVILTFDPAGSGLIAKDRYGYLKAFMVAGSDRKFVWAKARIAEGNKVVVSAPGVPAPVAVRYAWADNPDDANLYNLEGLPASPFRTDNW